MMKIYSTIFLFVHFIFFPFLLTFCNENSNAQCLTGNTKNYLVLDSFPGVRDFVEDDFTGDGVPDLAITFQDGSWLTEILKNDGNDNFSADTSFTIPYLNNLTES